MKSIAAGPLRLNLEFAHGRSGFQPTVENLPKGRHGSGEIFGGFFAVDCLVTKYKQKSAGKSASEKQKICQCKTPPRNPSVTPKNPPQNPPTNPPVKPPSTCRLLSIEQACSWRRLQSIDSGTLFGRLLGMVEAPMLKCTCHPSVAANWRDKVCCATLPDNTFCQSVRSEKTAEK